VTVQIHPLGLCESTSVGTGTRVWAFAHVMDGAVLGRDCNVGDHAFVETGAVVGDRVTIKNAVLLWDGVTVEDDVFLGPAVVFTNHLRPRSRAPFTVVPTLVRQGATLGAAATVVCGIVVGAFSFVAAGAVLTRSVPDHAFMAGSPARQQGWVCRCGLKLPSSLVCSCDLRFAVGQNGLILQ
jgi:UDP-2-acetamido-3-amino-2,3-dideoxy-glucuronate N-acetyltransferase